MAGPVCEDEDLAQRERAAGTWALVIRASGLDPEQLKQVRRLLRVHRSEIEGLLARLPGSVRRGARADLQPIADALCEAGIPAELVRRGAA
jgi:hypothetical protein